MRKLIFLIILAAAFVGYRYYKTNDLRRALDVSDLKQLIKWTPENKLLKEYPTVPREEIMTSKSPLAPKVYVELQERYKGFLRQFQGAVIQSGAELVVVFLSPEVGNSFTPSQRAGRPFIKAACQEFGIEYIDMSSKVEKMDPHVITQMPKDGHWSKAGAKVIGTEIASIVKAHNEHRSTITYPANERPSVLGDMKPGSDEVLDGGKNLPYRVKVNNQGLRIDFDLAFPKTKQRILLMGDSTFFFPFLDNPDTGTAVLQAQFPDKEIVNAAMWGYSLDDYVTLFTERAKYIEPDVVILETNGNDILDQFFAHRNRFSRTKKEYPPSAFEKAFYGELYGSGSQKPPSTAPTPAG